MASVTAGGPLGRAGEPASAGASRTSRDFKPGGARAGPAGSVCILGTLFLFSVRSRGFLKCKSSYNYVLTFKVQVG